MKKRKVHLEDIQKECPEMEYLQFYAYVMQKMENKELVPMKNAKSNGRKPALPLRFWKLEEETDYASVYEELKYKYHPLLNTSYYKEHPERYEADRQQLQLLSGYFNEHLDLLHMEESMNERSFEIFRREKFFQKKAAWSFAEMSALMRESWHFMRHRSRFPFILIPNRHHRIFWCWRIKIPFLTSESI